MKIAQVKFSVGKEHPLYNLYVEAEIVEENCGYDGRRTIARTTKPVFHAENAKGILVYKGDALVGYKTTPAYFEKHEGYVTDVK